MNVIFAKILAENFPDSLAVRFGFLTNAGIACGIWVCMSLGLILPDSDDYEANKENETWRIIFKMPAILGLFVMVMLLYVYKEDTITYCVQKGLKDEAKSAMKKLYRLKDSYAETHSLDDVIERHYNYLRKNTSMGSSDLTFKQVLFDPKYRRATWVCFVLNCFNQFSGVNALNQYAVRFLERIQEDSAGAFPVSPKNGSYVIGASNGISALCAILIMANFGRRPILIAGEATMAIFTFMTALGISQVWGMLSFIMLNAFLFSFHFS